MKPLKAFTHMKFHAILAIGPLTMLIWLSACAQVETGVLVESNTPAPVENTPAAPPTGTPTPTEIPAAEAARQLLAQQSGSALEAVTITSVEPVDWSDACLGVTQPDVMCAQVITPGYRVTLQLEGQEYVFHTDAAGVQVVPAPAPTPQVSQAILDWRFTNGDDCTTAIYTHDTLLYSDCSEEPLEGSLAFEGLRSELLGFVEKYASFEADTPAGSIVFSGNGDAQPTPAEQRMLAEWARMGVQIAQSGTASAARGLVLSWHREGGIAGFCDNVTIYLNGRADVGECRGSIEISSQRVQLTPEQLAQVYTWVDSLQSFEYEMKDPPVPDAMQLYLAFNGSGTGEASPEVIQAMQDLAAEVIEQSKPAPL